MTTFFLAITLMSFAMAAMAVGVIFSNRRLHGSCGGSGDDCVCEIEKRRACHAQKKMLEARASREQVSVLLAQGMKSQVDTAAHLEG
jgi:hypothetical protein